MWHEHTSLTVCHRISHIYKNLYIKEQKQKSKKKKLNLKTQERCNDKNILVQLNCYIQGKNWL